MPHRKRLIRREMDGKPRFITFSCYRSLPLLANPLIRDRLASDLCERAELDEIQLHAWVIMPNHAHLIATALGAVTISRFLHQLKSPFAFRVINRWRELDAPVLKHLVDGEGRTRFWQRGGGYDRVVLVNSELEEKIRYVHLNPVRKELCASPEGWAWSSAAEPTRRGAARP